MENAEKTKILVVDDEHIIANSLSWVLEIEGFETRATYSGEEAIKIAESFPPNILICDVLMTGISGVETAARIRQRFPSCKVLLISGHVSMVELLQDKLENEHRFDFLSKPVHPRRLIERLRTMLRTGSDSIAKSDPA
jgi:CheY-like chemotaxis protein